MSWQREKGNLLIYSPKRSRLHLCEAGWALSIRLAIS